MNQQEQLPFKTFQLLQLQWQQNNFCLSVDQYIKSKFLGSNQEINILCLQNNQKDSNTYFIVELQNETENRFLYYGDLIAIKHFDSQLYLKIDDHQKRDKQNLVDAYLDVEPEYFVIQPPEEANTFLLKYINQTISHPFRLLSSNSRNYLICSQQKNQTNIDIKGKEKLNTQNQTIGLWNFNYLKSSNNILNLFNKVHSEPIFVESGRKVIIRNWWTGFTLHSHNTVSKINQKQEVTCFSHPRDGNDFWSIVKQNSKNTSKFINYDDQIFFQHIETAQYLNGSDEQSYSKLGNLVFCSEQPQLFYTQAFDEFLLEMYKPFTIKFNNQFLAQSTQKAESNIGIQQECIYLQNQTQACLWIIERMI